MRKVLTMLAVVALATVLGAAGCADRFVLPPVPHPAPDDGSPYEKIAYRDGVVEAFHARSPGAAKVEPEAFVLRFSGDAGGAAKFFASRWQHRPVEVWVVNYPGYGGSTGPRTLKSLASASLAAYDDLRKRAGDRPIILEGFSLGTVPALHVAANRPVSGLILQNSPPLRQVILRHGWWNLWLLAGTVARGVPNEFDSLANAKRCTAPAVFLMAENDRSIPPPLQQRIHDAYQGDKRLILQRGADHADPLDAATEAELHDAMDWLLVSAAKARTTQPARDGEKPK
jgi:pimeloyl-ACP methyl ester carboxylesterase